MGAAPALADGPALGYCAHVLAFSRPFFEAFPTALLAAWTMLTSCSVLLWAATTPRGGPWDHPELRDAANLFPWVLTVATVAALVVRYA